MLQYLSFVSEQEITEWIKKHIHSEDKILSAGYQGKTLLFYEKDHKLVIKVPLGNLFTRPINRALLRHEYRVYQKLENFDAVPICYGLVNNEYLVIEYIEGKTIRQCQLNPDSEYFVKLLAAIKEMHLRGVAHFDLKRSENLLVMEGDEPILIDFGVSIIKKNRFHWLNNKLFKLAKQFDFNAWARHKYQKKMHLINQEDRQYYNKTRVEIFSKKIKRFYKDKFKGLFRSRQK
ncbi:hypothetical protein MNBD_GAMMA07-2149 [hydrothermal vent metagenome]|uniref:Protein kinase domain-containing protein n=1 Tax=hydrothermal vent metagenome TaxID=652676 RepID=A0A3B0WNR8_9ZZZZ